MRLTRVGLVAGAIYLLLGLAGGYAHYKRDRWSFGFFGPLMFTITLALIFYMNFKYGYSQSPELGNTVPREVRDRDYFYLWGFSAWSVWAGLGIVLLWEQLAGLLSPTAEGEAKRIPRKSWLLTTPVFLLAIVPLHEVWVLANFKETQLAEIRPGQPVLLKVDAYPDKVFHGHVQSIQAGTGSRFSLLPPENATGNYVKVVQRVPVKIVFDDPPDPDHPLGSGMSVVPTVIVR